jgi:hypothetical protein
MEGKKMASERRRLKGLARAIGFFSGAVLLGVFIRAGTAFLTSCIFICAMWSDVADKREKHRLWNGSAYKQYDGR